MKRKVRTAIGVILSLLLLAWALRGISFTEVAQHLRDADYVLFTLSIVVVLIGVYIRTVRWGILLLPVAGRVPFRPRLATTFIGFAVNNILPARIGEFARVYSLGKLTDVRVGSAFATLVIERMLDGLVLVGLLFAAMAAPGFPAGEGDSGLSIRSAALVVAVGMAGVGAGLYFAIAAPARAAGMARVATRVLPSRLREPTLAALRSFASGLAVLRSPRLFAVSVLLATVQWVFLGVSFYLAFLAFGITQVPFSGAIFLQSLVSLAVAIPSSPGFFGPFEAGSRIGLALWDVPAGQAISFAIGFHIGGFIPVTLIGIYYIWRLNLDWSAVRSSEETVEGGLEAAEESGAVPAGGARP